MKQTSHPSLPFVPEYPADRARRGAWVRALRTERTRHEPIPPSWLTEFEPLDSGTPARGLVIFLRNRACPWSCVFCDLWRHAPDRSESIPDIPSQIDAALNHPEVTRFRPTHVKLYNAGSYFDAGAIPGSADPAVAQKVGFMDRVIVESHPLLVGDRCWRFRDRLMSEAHARGRTEIRLEVAMGLETVNEPVLERLNKGMGLTDFARASNALRREGVELRAFVLVQPPFQDPGGSVAWAVRSAEYAFEQGAGVVSLIAVRPGNGALEALAAQGKFVPPTLAQLEAAHASAMNLRRGRVFADTWELERIADCNACFEARRSRLEAMNRLQQNLPPVSCERCGQGS